MITTSTNPFTCIPHETAFTNANKLASDFFEFPYSQTNYVLLINALTTVQFNDYVTQWYNVYAITHKFLFGQLPTIDHSVISEMNTSIGGICKVNDLYQNVWMTDITEVTLTNLYPTTLFHIYDETKMKCSISGFSKVYETVLTLRPTVKKIMKEMGDSLSEEQMSALQNVSLLLKQFINTIFGFIGSKHSLVKINYVCASDVTQRSSLAVQKILDTFAGHWVYVDIDTIYFHNFKEIESRFKEFVSTNKMTSIYNFEYEYDKSGMFIARKKYIINDNKTGKLEIKGFKII